MTLVQNEPKSIKLWTTNIKKVYLGSNQVRPKLIPITTPWIYRNQTKWLISLSSDGSSWITMADKNLWATTVYNNGDALSQANCGKFYQWGNNYWFIYWTPDNTSDTRVDASIYSWQNPYSSNVFIKQQWWNSAQTSWTPTTDLWGSITDTLEARKWPCNNWYHIPSKDEWTTIFNMWNTRGIWANNNPAWILTYLKIPASWYINYNSANINWNWWFTALLTTTQEYRYAAYSLIIRDNSAYWNNQVSIASVDNWAGYSIRPFKNDAVQPDDSRTKLYQPS